MKKSQDIKPEAKSIDDAAAEEVALIVRLATRALHGLPLDDDELDALCNAAFPQIDMTKKNGKHEPS